jgi:hypothetical protein
MTKKYKFVVGEIYELEIFVPHSTAYKINGMHIKTKTRELKCSDTLKIYLFLTKGGLEEFTDYQLESWKKIS